MAVFHIYKLYNLAMKQLATCKNKIATELRYEWDIFAIIQVQGEAEDKH